MATESSTRARWPFMDKDACSCPASKPSSLSIARHRSGRGVFWQLGMETVMKCVSIVAATLLATNASAQVVNEPAFSDIAPTTGEAEQLLPERCELLEVVNGAKMWKGDCISRPATKETIVRKKKRRKGSK